MSEDQYLDPYRESVASFGSRFEATLWASQASQVKRFRVFHEMCPLQGRRILDAGCSRGDLAQYLVERGVTYEKYVGIDAMPEVIAFAATRGLRDSEFHVANFVTTPAALRIGTPDVICISGAMNTMSRELVLKTIEAAWDATLDVLMFNFLSSRQGPHGPRQAPPVVRHDPLWLMDWALKKTWCVTYRQDYFDHGHDGTICMSRRGLPQKA